MPTGSREEIGLTYPGARPTYLRWLEIYRSPEKMWTHPNTSRNPRKCQFQSQTTNLPNQEKFETRI